MPWSLLTQAALFGVWVAGTDFLTRRAQADSADSLPCPSHTRFLGALTNRVSCSTQPAWHQNHLVEPPISFVSFLFFFVFKFAFYSKFSIFAVEAGIQICFSKVVLNSRHGARANLGTTEPGVAFQFLLNAPSDPAWACWRGQESPRNPRTGFEGLKLCREERGLEPWPDMVPH